MAGCGTCGKIPGRHECLYLCDENMPITGDREYVLKALRTLLQYCDGAFERDEMGYDRFDAKTARKFLRPDIDGVEGLADEEIEYLRRKLLRYRKQLGEYGIDVSKLENPVAETWAVAHGQRKGGPYGRISIKKRGEG